ncbi:MAG: hypothetical protein KF752_03130 [Pirellulaceae bacterium]|nr:hypothetical protein [Pirellulaceae bacterium]
MTEQEIISEVRSIAKAMAIPRVLSGVVSLSLKYRVRQLLIKAGVPFGPWSDGRQYLTKPGTIMFNGSPVATQVHRAVVDDYAVELCNAIVQHLQLVDWDLLSAAIPEYSNWTPEQAEEALSHAANVLPKLVDELEAYSQGALAKPEGAIEETERKERGLELWNSSPAVQWSDVAVALDGTPETKKAVTEEIKRYAKANKRSIRKAKPGAKKRK